MKSRCRGSKRKGRPMRLGEPSKMQATINITPLVDVVLVLLIIFMVVAPLMLEGYDVDVPRASAHTSAQVGEAQFILTIGAAACPILAPPPDAAMPNAGHMTPAGAHV